MRQQLAWERCWRVLTALGISVGAARSNCALETWSEMSDFLSGDYRNYGFIGVIGLLSLSDTMYYFIGVVLEIVRERVTVVPAIGTIGKSLSDSIG